VTKTNLLWKGSERSRIGTPVVENGRIYWFDGLVANCIDAATGKQVYRTKFDGGAAPEVPQLARPRTGQPGPGASGPNQPGSGAPGRRPGGGFSGRGGGMRGQDYSSPVLVNGTIYFLSRSGVAFVYATGPKFKLLSQNRFASDGGDFSSTPAISDGQLFIRSSKYLYCVAEPIREQGR
jgi:outer membrane protein assembly factor BamB